MVENTKWRAKAFPVHADQKTEQLLVNMVLDSTQEPSISAGEMTYTGLFWSLTLERSEMMQIKMILSLRL